MRRVLWAVVKTVSVVSVANARVWNAAGYERSGRIVTAACWVGDWLTPGPCCSAAACVVGLGLLLARRRAGG